MRFLQAVLLIVALGTAAFAVQGTKGLITGRVVNDRGKGISGAKVKAEGDNGAALEATANEKGEFSLELDPGGYLLSFEADGYANTSLRDRVAVETGKRTKLKERVQMPTARQGSIIRGSVFSADGRSIAGVKVFLERIPGENGQPVPAFKNESRSDTTGLFSFRVPRGEGRYRLTAFLDGYQTTDIVVDVFGGEILNAPPLKMIKKAK